MKTIRFALILLALACLAPWQSAKAADVICYNCPPEWADWASMLKAIKTDLHYDIPYDNKNSGLHSFPTRRSSDLDRKSVV